MRPAKRASLSAFLVLAGCVSARTTQPAVASTEAPASASPSSCFGTEEGRVIVVANPVTGAITSVDLSSPRLAPVGRCLSAHLLALLGAGPSAVDEVGVLFVHEAGRAASAVVPLPPPSEEDQLRVRKAVAQAKAGFGACSDQLPESFEAQRIVLEFVVSVDGVAKEFDAVVGEEWGPFLGCIAGLLEEARVSPPPSTRVFVGYPLNVAPE